MEEEKKTNAQIAAEIYPEVVERVEKSDNLETLRREERKKSILKNRENGIIGDDLSLALCAALMVFLGDIFPILGFIPVVGVLANLVGSISIVWNIGALFFGLKAMRKYQEIRKFAPADKRGYWLGFVCAIIGGFSIVAMISEFLIKIIFLILRV